MFFRKRQRVSEFLESLVLLLLTDDGAFSLEGFYEEYLALLEAAAKKGEPAGGISRNSLQVNRDQFTDLFIGTLLWLIKYRTLSNMFNSPRRQAWLDLNYDTAIPGIVDKTFGSYNTEVIKETYDNMDIECKKAYTGSLQKGDKPRFLVSPLWVKKPEPHPFLVAARLFIEAVGHGGLAGSKGASADFITDSLVEMFHSMTDSAAEAARKVNLI